MNSFGRMRCFLSLNLTRYVFPFFCSLLSFQASPRFSLPPYCHPLSFKFFLYLHQAIHVAFKLLISPVKMAVSLSTVVPSAHIPGNRQSRRASQIGCRYGCSGEFSHSFDNGNAPLNFDFAPSLHSSPTCLYLLSNIVSTKTLVPFASEDIVMTIA